MVRTRIVALVALTTLAACGGRSFEERLLAPQHIQAASTAARTIALGISDWRQAEGRPAICVGQQTPSRQVSDFQALLSRRLADTAPVVVDARECTRDGSTGWKVIEGDIPAVRVSPGSIIWQTNDLGVSRAGVELNLQDGFNYDIRVERLGGPWYVDDVYCNPGRNGLCVAIDPRLVGP